MDGYERTAAILKALAHPVRLQIVAVLRQEEACVCHLETVLHQRQAAISQHLARLRDAGLVVDRREGMHVFYTLRDESIGALVDAAQHTAVSLGKAGVEPLVFRSFAVPHPGCPCPRCQEKHGRMSI
jgi:ArsR family transcriptional regulator